MASRGVNKVILIGNLGADPEVRYTPSGNAVANISLATSESWRDKQSGEVQERTEWHRIVFFNRLAEIVGEFLRKGSKCYVEGSLRTRKWQDKNGIDRYTTEIIASEMCILDSRGGGGSASANVPSGERAAQSAAAMQAAAAAPITTSAAVEQPSMAAPAEPATNTGSGDAFGGSSDDIPF